MKAMSSKPAARSSGKRNGASPPLEPDALHQKQTRQQHAQERAQDYAEAIADLIERTGEARATDLARRLGVTHVTVIRTVARLKQQGLVSTRPYRSIFLTDSGKSLAAQTRQRHQIVVRFLEALGISARAAHADAEGIEHHVSEETLAAFKAFLKKRDA
jgi:DtxR family manganese transport transcriptional regulator